MTSSHLITEIISQIDGRETHHILVWETHVGCQHILSRQNSPAKFQFESKKLVFLHSSSKQASGSKDLHRYQPCPTVRPRKTNLWVGRGRRDTLATSLDWRSAHTTVSVLSIAREVTGLRRETDRRMLPLVRL